MDNNKKKALDFTISQIQKQHGVGSIMRLGDNASLNVEVISTGSLKIDNAIGVGGVPKGRIIEIIGHEASGKTTVALHIIKEAQAKGGKAGFVDSEHALDLIYAKNLGVNINELIVSQPDCGEHALEITEMLVRSGAIDVIVIDSVSALTPKKEIEGEMGDSHVGLQARMMSQALRKLAGAIKKSNCTVIFINQYREKVGVMFGSPLTTSGGRALKFYSSVRMEVKKVDVVKDGAEVIGIRVKLKVIKNKVAPPFRTCEYTIEFGKGIDTLRELIDVGVEKNVINKIGSWYSYNNIRLGQGVNNSKNFLETDEKLIKEITAKILECDGKINSEKNRVV